MYNKSRAWGRSSAGQSATLTSWRSKVRALSTPPVQSDQSPDRPPSSEGGFFIAVIGFFERAFRKSSRLFVLFYIFLFSFFIAETEKTALFSHFLSQIALKKPQKNYMASGFFVPRYFHKFLHKNAFSAVSQLNFSIISRCFITPSCLVRA